MNLGDRLKLARKYAELTQVALASKADVPQQNISSIESGNQEKSADVVRLAVACGVRAEWLDLGIEPMVEKYQTADEQLIRAMQIMEQLPDYARQHAIKEIIETAELIKRAKDEEHERPNGSTG